MACFNRSLLPGTVALEGYDNMAAICAWGALNEDEWKLVAVALGDADFKNISLFAAMQPADIRDAIGKANLSIISQTKVRLVYAAARLKFGMEAVDVSVTSVAALSPALEAVSLGGPAPRASGKASVKIKVVHVLDQAADWEADKLSDPELMALRAVYRSMEGEDPMKTEEVTDDQLSVLAQAVRAGISPIHGLRRLAAVRPASGEEDEVHCTLHGHGRPVEGQGGSRAGLLNRLGGMLARFSDSRYHDRCGGTGGVG